MLKAGAELLTYARYKCRADAQGLDQLSCPGVGLDTEEKLNSVAGPEDLWQAAVGVGKTVKPEHFAEFPATRPREASMSAARRAFVIMPFGKKKLPDGAEVDCDDLYKRLFEPAITAAGLKAHRADADRRGGSIHLDMFQDLLLSEFVVADLTMDNPNVWYEIGVRHALRAGGTVMTYAARERLPFDIAGQRMQRYTLKEGKLDPDRLEDECKALTKAIEATLGAWRGRRASPVYQMIPSLQEPDWKTLKVGDVNEYWEALDAWRRRIDVARRNQRPGDILVLAEETPNSLLEFEALRRAADALLRMNQPHYALKILERARKLDPDDLKAIQLEGVALGRDQRFAEARETLAALAAKQKDGESLGIFARTWKDEWTQVWNAHPSARTIQSRRRATPPRRFKAPPAPTTRRFARRPASTMPASTR